MQINNTFIIWTIICEYYMNNFLIITRDIFISNIISTVVEFGNAKFPKSIPSKDGVWREFLEIDNNSTFSKKMITSKIVNFLSFFSVSKL